VEPEVVAQEAGLRYADSSRPGYTRRRAGTGFWYRDTRGERITDKAKIERIRKLAIPPAWTDVWICPSPNGHVQATGLDARGRKQYIYHPRWREWRDEAKYHRLVAFAETLPLIRRAVEAGLRRKGLPKEKVVAAVVSLLQKTLVRVGNDSYARDNRSYGLTTLRDRHVEVSGSTIHFAFRGKAGIDHRIDLEDRRLARIVKQTQDLPGQELFQYVADDGEVVDITSDDVNTWLREVSGEDFTAKDFRTWAGTVLAATELAMLEPPASQTASNRDIVGVIDRVAKHLGNTRAICRSCYVHPEVLAAYAEQEVIAEGGALRLEPGELPFGRLELSECEKAVLAFLKRRAAPDANQA
jgi:DNA topoisomerase-1